DATRSSARKLRRSSCWTTSFGFTKARTSRPRRPRAPRPNNRNRRAPFPVPQRNGRTRMDDTSNGNTLRDNAHALAARAARALPATTRRVARNTPDEINRPPPAEGGGAPPQPRETPGEVGRPARRAGEGGE